MKGIVRVPPLTTEGLRKGEGMPLKKVVLRPSPDHREPEGMVRLSLLGAGHGG